ncbi:MAG: hypothetical protein LIO65_03715 [Odoribacter sp.]|nr:hypothetical protein [Odoribacter sp.]
MNGVEANSKSYDILVNIGLNYTINPYLNISALGGLYYNYVKEDLFIPGKSSMHAIAPLMNGSAENSVRSGTGEGLNYYLRGTLSFDKTFSNVHDVTASLGYQLISSRREFDCGSGINTTSDFYNTLSNINTSYGRTIVGYINEWNWMNAYLTGRYDFRKQYYVTGNLVIDASSSYGSSTGRVFVFPSAQNRLEYKKFILS